MKADGWDKKPGVHLIKGRWQDVVAELGRYDGIFFDTYSEFYDDLRQVIAQPKVTLLSDDTKVTLLSDEKPLVCPLKCDSLWQV